MKTQSVGLVSMELHVPKTFISQTDFEKSKGLPTGKITKGLGQNYMSFVSELEDVNSMALTVLRNLMTRNNLKAADIGKLEFATETLHDKSKSSKTILMRLLQQNKDIEGVTHINACYGGTAAIFNCLSWLAADSKGQYAVVVMSDVAVYDNVSAKPTGGAGAVAVLLGHNPQVTIDPLRSSFFNDEYDFFKPHMDSEYPVVKGHYSMQLFNTALLECFQSLKSKHKREGNPDFGLTDFDYFCMHCPFTKQVEKGFLALCYHEIVSNDYVPSEPCGLSQFLAERPKLNSPDTQTRLRKMTSSEMTNRLNPSLELNKSIGNIYNGSLYLSLLSLVDSLDHNALRNKKVMMYSYGAGVAASVFALNFSPTFSKQAFMDAEGLHQMLSDRNQTSIDSFEALSCKRESVYNSLNVSNEPQADLLRVNTYYLQSVNNSGERCYAVFVPENPRLSTIANGFSLSKPLKKFREMELVERVNFVNNQSGVRANNDFKSGGIDFKTANMMIENCVGSLRLPLGIAVGFVINGKRLLVPMVTEEPSVVAAASNSATLISTHSSGFTSTASRCVVRGQLYLEQVDSPRELFIGVNRQRLQLMLSLNAEVSPSIIERGGGVIDLVVSSHPDGVYSVNVFVDVQNAMGANTVNGILENLKPRIVEMIKCNVVMAIVSNMSPDRIVNAWFEIPVECLAVGDVPGAEVARKIILANDIAKHDLFRTTTHNKGIMNGIDAVALAVGQDFRAIEASCHTYTILKLGKYAPLTQYALVDGGRKLRGEIEVPFVVGTVGGMTKMNSLYQLNLKILGQPDAKDLGGVIACVGLAQNLAALRSLVSTGLQKGHMKLHAKSIAVSLGVDFDQVQEAVEYMIKNNSISYESAREFLRKRTSKL